MKKILIVSGSRADYGMLEWPRRLLSLDDSFSVEMLKIWKFKSWEATRKISAVVRPNNYSCVVLLGDRFEILGSALSAHLARVPIAHIGGGDISEGSYDDAMRDCISRMASIHFATSTASASRLATMGCHNVHMVGSPGIDYIKHAKWKSGRPFKEPYVVVSYQPETLDGHIDLEAVYSAIHGRKAVVFLPNPDKGSDEISQKLIEYAKTSGAQIIDFLPHDEFLNLLSHCEEFIGNSSAMLYEAPELGINTHMIGKRQRGRVIPWGDGHASQRIVKILKYSL